MSKPIYLDQDLCAKLQSKGLECGSGMWWEFEHWKRADGTEGDEWRVRQPFDVGNAINPPERYKAYELHIDILGSRENLVKLFGPKNPTGASYLDDIKNTSSMAAALLNHILADNPDQAINLIKEAVWENVLTTSQVTTQGITQ